MMEFDNALHSTLMLIKAFEIDQLSTEWAKIR